jgi:hypothetical protein
MRVIIVVVMLMVVAVLLAGLVVMIRGGEVNKKYGNKLMVARVALQALAVGLIGLAIFLSSHGE